MQALIKIIKIGLSLLLVGIFGMMLSMSGAGNYLEEEIGLDWLFRLRGALPPPHDVIIVSIDKDSAKKLNFSENPEHWPRTTYAQLIQKINKQNPSVIAFNLHFAESRDPVADHLLAKAMMAKKNVILSNYLKQDDDNNDSPIGPVRFEAFIDPISILNNAALCAAPFLLPKSSSTVKEFWSLSSGGIATFPASIFQYYAMKETYPEFLQILQQVDPLLYLSFPDSINKFSPQAEMLQIFHDIKISFTKDDASIGLTEQLISGLRYVRPKTQQLMQSWLGLMTSEKMLYLNHYGDAGAITTVPFYKVLENDSLSPELFTNKVVMVGYSGDIEPEKYQGFYTSFSKNSGKVVSPVEIAATAVANLIDQSWLKPQTMEFRLALVLLWGMVLSGLFRFLSYKIAMILTMVLTVVYWQTCYYEFISLNRWQPLVVPMFQAGVVILWESAVYLLTLRDIANTFIPEGVIDENIRNPKQLEKYGAMTQGVCFKTDAGQYTSLSEKLNPLQLHNLMNRYYDAFFPGVKKRNGQVIDMQGDAILAVFGKAKISAQKLCSDACYAALETKATIDDFNSKNQFPLPTRFGLHFGEMMMGNVGGKKLLFFRAVGDTVNTAARIEELNKLLGTRILVTSAVMEGQHDFFSRELGAFLFKGKLQPVNVCELLGTAEEIRRTCPHLENVMTLFAKAFAFYKNTQWQAALDEFRVVSKIYPEDGPTRFFISYLQYQLSLDAEQLESNKRTLIIDAGNIIAMLHPYK